jgi:hypothetical protein
MEFVYYLCTIKTAFRAYQRILTGKGIGRYPFVVGGVRGLASVTTIGRWVQNWWPVDMSGFQLCLNPCFTSERQLGKGFDKKKEAAYARAYLKPGDLAVNVDAILFQSLPRRVGLFDQSIHT